MTKEAREQFSKIIQRQVKYPGNLSDDLIDYIEGRIWADTGIPILTDVNLFLRRYYIKDKKMKRGHYLTERQACTIEEVVELLLTLDIFFKKEKEDTVVITIDDETAEVLSQHKLDLKKEIKI